MALSDTKREAWAEEGLPNMQQLEKQIESALPEFYHGSVERNQLRGQPVWAVVNELMS